MKTIFLLIGLFVSSQVFSKAAKPQFSMSFQDQSRTHLYSVREIKNGFELQLKMSEKSVLTKSITGFQLNSIRAHAIRILWTSKYRAPANTVKCNKYAAINVDGEKETICLENQKAMELSYALLNSLRKNF
jgi:hypothetical protein